MNYARESYLSFLRSEYLRDIARDADIEIPTSRPLDSICNHASLAMDILVVVCPLPSIDTSLLIMITSEAPISFLITFLVRAVCV